MVAALVNCVDRARDVLFLLPPDVSVPVAHLEFRFPPLGPAVVAACVPSMHFRAFDVALDIYRRPFHEDWTILADGEAVARHLLGENNSQIDAVLERIWERIGPHVQECDLIAISVDRGSQVPLTALLSVHIKKRWDKRIIVGGVAMDRLRDLLLRSKAMGADIVTTASTPHQIRQAFATILELPEHRRGPPIESNADVVTLVRGGMRKAPSPVDWPMPDFSIYDLRAYRRDSMRTQFPSANRYRDDVGESLALPYFLHLNVNFHAPFARPAGHKKTKISRTSFANWLRCRNVGKRGNFCFLIRKSICTLARLRRRSSTRGWIYAGRIRIACVLPNLGTWSSWRVPVVRV